MRPCDVVILCATPDSYFLFTNLIYAAAASFGGGRPTIYKQDIDSDIVIRIRALLVDIFEDPRDIIKNCFHNYGRIPNLYMESMLIREIQERSPGLIAETMILFKTVSKP